MRSLIISKLSIFFTLLLAIIQISVSSSSLSVVEQLAADGKIIDLTESNFDEAIAKFDYVFVDFYAPWCGHCQRLNPELDAAAPVLARLKTPIVIAKVNADKHTRLARKQDIDGFPTLKLFIHGVPMDYYGPRKADLLVRYLNKFVAPDVSVLDSDAAVSDFAEAAGTSFPIYIGFGLNESVISTLGAKYKKKAWFAVAKDFSEDQMILYDFDKVPALVVRHPNYDERSVFYGPFEDDKFLEDFVKQNLLPLTVPMNRDTLKLLKDDDRKIVLTIVEDEADEKSRELIEVLRAAASANRDLVFGYVGVKQWDDFADSFEANKLPKMVVWDGDEEYHTVTGSESLDYEEDKRTQVSLFMEGYRQGRTEVKRISGPSFMGFIKSLVGMRMVLIAIFLVGILILILNISLDSDEPPRVRTPQQQVDQTQISETESSDYKGGDKED